MPRLMADSGPGNAAKILSVVPGVSIIAASPGWTTGTWAQFPPWIGRLRYTHDPADYTADILDVEPAYAQPSDVPLWLQMRQQHGLPAGTVYANVSRIDEVRKAAAGMPFHWWANAQELSGGQPYEVPGAVATQYYGSRQAGWQGVDISVISDPNWPSGGAVTTAGQVPQSPGPPPPSNLYQNPLRAVRGLQPARIDMGVDYFGSGPVYALGKGKVTEVDTSWAGGFGDVGPGTFIQYQLTEGPLAGYYVYLAEHVRPSVQVGQQITPQTQIGTISGGIETGFGSGKPGQTAAAAAGQSLPPPQDPGGRPTAYGWAFSELLQHLGAPAGTGGQNPFGTLPQNLIDYLRSLLITGIPGTPPILPGLGGFLGGLTELGHYFGVLVSGLTDVHMWISLGWIALGAWLLFLGIILWLRLPQRAVRVGSAAASRGLA